MFCVSLWTCNIHSTKVIFGKKRDGYALKRTFAWFPLNFVLSKMNISKLELSITLSSYTVELNNWNQDKTSQAKDQILTASIVHSNVDCFFFFFELLNPFWFSQCRNSKTFESVTLKMVHKQLLECYTLLLSKYNTFSIWSIQFTWN